MERGSFRSALGRGAEGVEPGGLSAFEHMAVIPPGQRVMHLAAGDLWAGAEVQIHELLRALARKGFSPEAVLFNEGVLADKLRAEGMRVHVLPEREWGPLRIFLQIRKLLLKERPQWLHTHGLKANVLGGAAAALAGVTSLRTVHSRPGGGWVMKLDHLSARYLQQAVVSVSDELTPLLRSRYGEKVHQIENGLAVAELSALRKPKPTDGCVHIGFVARLVPVKRVDLFLCAAKTLNERAPGKYLFHVYGDGPGRQRAEAMIAELGLGEWVRLEGFRSDLAAGLSSLHLLMMPSDHEGLPMAMLEALALQVPVVAHAVGGMVRVLEITGGGELVRRHTAEGYATAVETLLEKLRQDPDLPKRAFRRLESHYDISRTADEYIGLYRALKPRRSG